MADNEDNAEPARGPATALGIGERLRSARKAKALSVQQVAEVLRLEEPGVIALEEGRFDAMGAPVFVRGHLRRYAQLVGLSPETVLDAYRAATPDSDAPPSLARPRTRAEAVRMPRAAWWGIAALVVIGLVVALGNGADEPQAPATVATAPSAAPVAAPTTPAELPPGSARLALRFTEDSWVEIDDAERRVLYGLQSRDTSQEIVVRVPVKIMLGNARAVSVALDGEPVPIAPGDVTNNIARFEIGSPVAPVPPDAGAAGAATAAPPAADPAGSPPVPATTSQPAPATPAGTAPR